MYVFRKKNAEEAEISNDIAPPIGTKQNKTNRTEMKRNGMRRLEKDDEIIF